MRSFTKILNVASFLWLLWSCAPPYILVGVLYAPSHVMPPTSSRKCHHHNYGVEHVDISILCHLCDGYSAHALSDSGHTAEVTKVTSPTKNGLCEVPSLYDFDDSFNNNEEFNSTKKPFISNSCCWPMTKFHRKKQLCFKTKKPRFSILVIVYL